jgi:lipopolysaccharide transport system ATP-binding protein
MIDDIAISVKNVTKTYRLYNSHADRVKEAFHPLRKKYYNPFNALADVSFDVKKGETLGIIGRNGSGKSTMLQIICGILRPTSGYVEVNGRVSALLELGAGFNPEFTGRQNVYINGSILGLTHEEIETRFDDIAAFSDIGKYIDQPVKTYSSGMYVRLAFAVIAHVDADILFFAQVYGAWYSFIC